MVISLFPCYSSSMKAYACPALRQATQAGVFFSKAALTMQTSCTFEQAPKVG